MTRHILAKTRKRWKDEIQLHGTYLRKSKINSNSFYYFSFQEKSRFSIQKQKRLPRENVRIAFLKQWENTEYSLIIKVKKFAILIF